MSRIHRTLAGIAGAGLLSAVAIGTADGAQAHSTSSPPPSGYFAPSEFQCGPNNWVGALVPDNPPGGANFHDACVAHDRCYDTGSSTDRKSCDGQFLNRMLRACDDAGQGGFCDGIAYTYYYAVRGAGWSFYKGSGANN